MLALLDGLGLGLWSLRSAFEEYSVTVKLTVQFQQYFTKAEDKGQSLSKTSTV